MSLKIAFSKIFDFVVLDHKWTFVMQSDTVLKKMSQIFYFLMIRDRRKLMTLLELHGEFVVGFFVPNCALFNRKILGKYLVGPFSISICHAFSGSCMHVTVFSTFWIWTKSLFLEYLLLVPMHVPKYVSKVEKYFLGGKL